MIEVHDVVVQRVGDQDQVANVGRVGRDLEAERVFHGANRGDGVDGGAHSAKALGKDPGLARIASVEDGFNSAQHRAGGPRFTDMAVVDFHVDAKVAFDPRDRVDDDSLSHWLGSPFQLPLLASGISGAGRIAKSLAANRGGSVAVRTTADVSARFPQYIRFAVRG